jgi:hypothetical protein
MRRVAEYAAYLAKLQASEHLYPGERAAQAREAAEKLFGGEVGTDPEMRRVAEYAAYLAKLQASEHLYPGERAAQAREAAEKLFGDSRKLADPLPARDVRESAGRERMEAGELPRALAYYRLLGQLHEADDPAVRAAELLAVDPAAVVVVSGDDDERRVRAALAGLNSGARGEAAMSPPVTSPESQKSQLVTPATPPAERPGVSSQPPEHDVDHEPSNDAWAGRIVRAGTAYEERRQRREEWAASDPRAQRAPHVVEPGAVPRAYVLATELTTQDDLIRSVSVAAESHVVTPSLRPTLAREVEADAQEIQESQDRRSAERSVEQARDAEIVHERQAREADASREGSWTMER